MTTQPSKNTTQCTKCLKQGHLYTECQEERLYRAHPEKPIAKLEKLKVLISKKRKPKVITVKFYRASEQKIKGKDDSSSSS